MEPPLVGAHPAHWRARRDSVMFLRQPVPCRVRRAEVSANRSSGPGAALSNREADFSSRFLQARPLSWLRGLTRLRSCKCDGPVLRNYVKRAPPVRS